MRNLGIDTLDVVNLRMMGGMLEPKEESVGERFSLLADLRRQGKIRHLGLTNTCAPTSLIEEVGRPRVEPSFLPEVVDRMIAVPDAASIAAARVVSRRLGKLCGGSTGTNVWACAALADEMAASGKVGSIVSILCDDGARYSDTIFDDCWLRFQGIVYSAYEATVERFFETGKFDLFALELTRGSAAFRVSP